MNYILGLVKVMISGGFSPCSGWLQLIEKFHFHLYFLSYKLLFTCNAAPLVAASPIAAKPHQPSAPSSTTSDGGNHANLTFIIGIAAGIAVVLAIAMIVICVCTFRRRHTKTSEELGEKDIGM